MYDKFLHSFNCRLHIDGTSHQHYIPYQIEIGISIVIFMLFWIFYLFFIVLESNYTYSYV